MEIPGGVGSNVKPSGMENRVAWGVGDQTEKKKPCVVGVWIFSGTTQWKNIPLK